MTILVTGGAGVVGSALIAALGSEDVVALAHRKPVACDALYGDITRPWLGLHPRDYRELAGRVDVVVHCAASVDFDASERTLHRVNVVGVGHVLRFVSDAEARLVHVSTAFVARIANGADAPHAMALAAYAQSKARGETLVRESGLPAAIARVSTVIGDSESGRLARLQSFHYILGAGMRGLLPFLPTTADTRADLVPQDVVAAALTALATTYAGDGNYWLTAGTAAPPMSAIMDIAYDIAVERWRADRDKRQVYAPALRPRFLAPDTYNQLMTLLHSHAGPDVKPSRLGQIDRLMATYNHADPFPTSLGEIPGGPPAPTEDSIGKALAATCRHLGTQPDTMWSMY
jgi:nucleoside-diphosphate-sugar epimerase